MSLRIREDFDFPNMYIQKVAFLRRLTALLICVLSLALPGCEHAPQIKPGANVERKIESRVEREIFDTIFKLPEVTARANYIINETNSKRNLKVIIYDKPTQSNPYYWVKAGEDNGISFVTHFNFFVYSDSMRLLFFDTKTDSIISLSEWRRRATE